MTVFIIALSFQLQGCFKSQESFDEASSSASDPAVQKAEMPAAPKNSDGTFKPFVVYTDANSPDNHYDPSGWMGDTGDLQMSQEFFENPRSGSTSIQVIYNAQKSQGAGWAGVYWQNPANNWGVRPGAYDLTGARKLTFWARGEKGNERIEEFKIGGITGDYPDSDVAGIGPVVLGADWKQYTLDLEGKDLSSISGGFCWAAQAAANENGATFYLDDIRYE